MVHVSDLIYFAIIITYEIIRTKKNKFSHSSWTLGPVL